LGIRSRVRGILQVTADPPDSNIQVYAQYNTQPTNASSLVLAQFDSANGNYFAMVIITQSTGTLYFGVYNQGVTQVSLATGRYNFNVDVAVLEAPTTVQSISYTIAAGTGAFFELKVPEATSLALFFALKFTDSGAFSMELDNLLVRRNQLPNIAVADSWAVVDYQSNAGVNGAGQQLGGWEGWVIQSLLTGTYYVSLFNSDTNDHTVNVTSDLTEIFALKMNTPQRVNAISLKNNVFFYSTSSLTSERFLQVNVTGLPVVRINQGVCPTTNTSQAWVDIKNIPDGKEYYGAVQPLTSYYIVAQNAGTGTTAITVSLQQTTNTGSSSNNNATSSIVQTDEYGDGVEPIEIAGIVLGTFIGIFSLCFIACFFLTLLQMDRNYWYNADPLSQDNSAL